MLRSAIVGLVFAAFLLACAPSGPRVEIGGYTFKHDGKEYRIESVTPSYSEGYNLLTRREGDRLLFKAIDKEQDGQLDELTLGDMTLDEARAVYREGILEGERRGYLKKRTFAREYRASDSFYDYELATYILATGEIYNKLTLMKKQAFLETAVVFDQDADGQIDRVEKGFGTVSEYQRLYRNLLDRGLREQKVSLREKRYIVVL
ncbi:hypothetical protein JW777_04415 [bacterium]|nr:hypothetical protein [bacterium]